MKITNLISKNRRNFSRLLCIAALSSCSMFTYAQQQQVQLSGNNISLKSAFKQIEKQTQLSIDYASTDFNDARLIKTVPAASTVDEVLTQLLQGTNCEIVYNKGHIIIKKKESHQQKSITGTVLDENGEPVIGANVLEKGTTNGTITDLDGKFVLDVPSNATLQISFIGYTEQNVKVGAKNSFNITMKEDSQLLDELVVVGYGVMKKSDLTGAVGGIKGDKLASRRTTQLSSALQGAVSGVMVTRNGNAPGASASSIKVRGVTTIGDSNPLVLIDDVPGSINDVNPNDVENITVLKDAASASIYGSRAAAGVILITTKRAKEKKMNLNYSFEYGLEFKPKGYDRVGPERFMEMSNELIYNDNPSAGRFSKYAEDYIKNYQANHLKDPDRYAITDWDDAFFKKTAPRQTHTLSLTGGGEKVKTNASFSYDKSEALYDNQSYERLMVRVNNDFKFNKLIGAKFDFNFKHSKNHAPVIESNAIDHARLMPAIYADRWSDGRIAADPDRTTNPIADIYESGISDSWYNQISGRLSLELHPIDGLVLSSTVAPTYNFNKYKKFEKALAYTLLDDPNTVIGYRDSKNTSKLTENRNDNYSITIQALANYIKSFGSHNLNAMLGYESYYQKEESLMASRDQYELNNFPYLNLGPTMFRNNAGSASEVAYRSYFGRIAYNYNNKYLFQVNVRRDGSSRFHKDNRWATFPSISAGWVMSEENFLKNSSLDWLSYLKVRASWGTLGNERIGKYPYQSTISFGNTLFYANGKPTGMLSAAQMKYAIRNISWETTESFDIGLDAQFFNSRLKFSADFYKKKTKDMLLALEIPGFVGFGNPQQNTGKMNTTGYELDLSWNDTKGDWYYGISANFSDFVSKMGDLGGTEFLGSQVKFEGSEFNEWYGYVSDGLIKTEEDLNSPKLNNSITYGDVKYKDISGPDGVPDGKISPEYDRVLLGGSLPRLMFGGNLNVGYKSFDLSMAFQGVGKRNVMYGTHMVQALFGEWGTAPAMIDGKYWSPFNTDEQNAKAIYPRITQKNRTANYTTSDYWKFNGRYVRLKNITLGYSLPKSLLEKIYLKQARFYISANDLFCISKYPKGWDPEMGDNAYPITKSLLFGVSVNF